MEHRQQLLAQFDQYVVMAHDELCSEMSSSNDAPNELLAQIDQWENETLNKVRQASERVRQELTHLFKINKEILAKEFETLAKDIRRRRQDDDFIEDEIKQLRQQIDQLRLSIQQLSGKDTAKVQIMKNDKIDWNRLIYIEKKGKYHAYQGPKMNLTGSEP
ncbi:unnamed protein product, partial [Rotaria sp. Silwood2]